MKIKFARRCTSGKLGTFIIGLIGRIWYLEAGLLKVHDGVADLDADGLHGHLDVEGPDEALGETGQGVWGVTGVSLWPS